MKKPKWIWLEFMLPILVLLTTDVLKKQFGLLSFTLFEELILAMCTAFLILLIRTLRYSKAAHSERLRHIATWKAVDEFDKLLEPIRADYRHLTLQQRHKDDNMFEELIRMELIQLQDEVKQAANKGQYPVKNHKIDSHQFLSNLFEHSASKVYKDIYILNPRDCSFDQYYIDFFRMIAELTQKRGISVQSLFVCEDKTFYNSPEVQRLFSFYIHTSKFHMRGVDQARINALRAEYSPGDSWIDFGLYGDQMLFKTKQDTSDEATEGEFSKNSTEIDSFNKLFDNAWKHGSKIKPNDPRTRITLDSLFSLN